jgi:hypothetical protein
VLQVSISGAMPPSCSLHADKLGDFVRLKGQESNKHTVYRKKEGETMLWHAGGAWWVGPLTSLGKQAGYWRCRDAARIPESTRGPWEVGDGHRWHVADGVRCLEYLMPRLVLKGATPEDRHQDKLGTYVLCEQTVNDRASYHQLGNPSRMIWFLTPCLRLRSEPEHIRTRARACGRRAPLLIWQVLVRGQGDREGPRPGVGAGALARARPRADPRHVGHLELVGEAVGR